MTPTNKLRFVRRAVPDRTFGDGIARYERILQQWWESAPTMNMGFGEVQIGASKGEWRDIPVENEE